MSHLRNKIPYVIIVSLYIATILLVNPRGEFPLNDDWSYTRSALQFATGNGMHVDEWSAPSLVGQALYGGLLIRAFGMKFLALRLSTLVASCAIALGLWFALAQLGIESWVAWLAVLSWIFNPLQLNLSFTYMTEVPFLFFIVISVVLYLFYLSRRRSWLLALAGVVLGYAFLIRQTAALFVAALVIALLLDRTGVLRDRLRGAVLAAASAGFFMAGYYLWLELQGGATPATRRKLELLRYLTAEQLAGNSFGLLFYMAFLLLPLWVALFPAALRLSGRLSRSAWIGCLAGWLVVCGAGLWWFHSHYEYRVYLPSEAYHSRMPFLLNVIYDTGVGPVTLDPAYFGLSPLPTYPRVWLIVTGATALGLVIAGLLFSFGLFRRLSGDEPLKPALVFFMLAFAFDAGFEIVFSHLQEGGLFDRHLVVAAFPLCLAACLLEGTSRISSRHSAGAQSSQEIRNVPAFPHQAARIRSVCRTAALLTAGAQAAFSICATHDYLEWNRLRWDLGNAALAGGVNPLDLSAGFEFNGWHNYETFRARGHVETVFQWWYDTRGYLISITPQMGYRIVRRESFFSWIHRRIVPLYLIQKCGPEG